MAPRRRPYPPDDPRFDPRYDPRYNPYARGGYGPGYGSGPGYGYGYRPGNSCLRDACLLETGCCLAESLDGGCLAPAVLLLPQFTRALTTPALSTPSQSTPALSMPGASGRQPGSRLASRLVAGIRVYQR